MLDKILNFIAKELMAIKYQVGDIYVTSNPNMNTAQAAANRFGGQWEQITGKFLLSAGGVFFR